jgi:ribonuclease PH
VLIEGGHIAEVQATAEGATYDEEGLLRLLRLARIGCDRIFDAQAGKFGEGVGVGRRIAEVENIGHGQG